ncbi:MAG TPA: ATP-binding protein [Clostridia bacterium]|nr:ATP-binding protein [Clostridia bacterium]
MFKTIFSKLIVIFLLILVIAFTVTAVMMNVFLDNYITEEKATALEEASSYINLIFRNFLVNIDPNDSQSVANAQKVFRDYLALQGNSLRSIIWMTYSNGVVFQSNWSMPELLANKYKDKNGDIKLPLGTQFSRLAASETTVREVGNFNGLFKDPILTRDQKYAVNGDIWLTVGRSFKYTGTDNKDIMVLVFMSTPVKEVGIARTQVFRYFLISMGAAILIAVILIYIFSLRLSHPLKQIKTAASRIASGEFEKRLDIKSKDEIGDLARTFNQMAVALQNIEEMRRGFVANVSHELRTPMTSIRGFVDGILDGTIPPEKQSHYLTIVRDETLRLNRLVNDLLDLARMEAGEVKLNFTVFDINELVRKCVIKLESLLLEKGLTVDADFEEEDLPVRADSDSIERVIYNLMHNAIKFTPAGGKISIATLKRKDKAEIVIKDTGIGIEQSDLDMIWDRFYKADKSRSRDKTGTGLGLAIVRNIINEHGQDIWAESRPGEGTAFTFTLDAISRESEVQPE